ncbi:DUF481 domain-containing protein [Reichenbachiella carrageenanivorans]|uniref:DUF481 domain-containing protein n=1 Tax=Reichenbachiella carrageenanivorans TaxID=2979869 RepID=A0ABY6CXY3_9BACT|nr:DUF481 domain-containing protein [Reichenbachiella carrageenanivorans]UXX78229.1 DUF481 domain-containing protein [Reichenbachiella carrageenanivorans]
MKYYLLPLILFFAFFQLKAQDTVELSNGDKIVGSVKQLNNGVLEIETPYSESNFMMDWESVVNFTSTSTYMINMANGKRITGQITMKEGSITILTDEGETMQYNHLQMVYLKSVNSGFWDRISLSLDGGYTLSKANDNKQLTLRGNASYLSEKINPDVYFNFVNSKLDDGTSQISTKRNNYGANLRVFFVRSWFGIAGADYLTNDEQSLELRSTYKIGVGNFLIRNHKMYLSTSLGSAWNNENYDIQDQENLSTTEGYLSIDYQAFGLSDFTATTGVQAFHGLNDSNRTRINFNIDLKFDLPKDFYIGAGYTLNYDSNPQVDDIPNSDYVIQTTVGWSL